MASTPTRGASSNGRELDRLCGEHDAYRWLAGGLSFNYHTINDFRVENDKALDDLLTQMLAALTRQGLVKVQRISVDGTRVRAGGRQAAASRRMTRWNGTCTRPGRTWRR